MSLFYNLSYEVHNSEILQHKLQLKLNSYICVFKYMSKYFHKEPQLNLVHHGAGEKKGCFKPETPRQLLDLIHFS